MKVQKRLPYHTELENKLNDLCKELNNAIKRFQSLSQIAKSDALVSFYQKKLEERSQFRLKLESQLQANNTTIESSGTVTGALIRLHTRIKVMFDNNEDQVSLTRATYYEESLLYDYRRVLEKPEILNKDLIALLENQSKSLEDDINQMQNFKYSKF